MERNREKHIPVQKQRDRDKITFKLKKHTRKT